MADFTAAELAAFDRFVAVQKAGKHNMFTDEARRAAKLTKHAHVFVMENYKALKAAKRAPQPNPLIDERKPRVVGSKIYPTAWQRWKLKQLVDRLIKAAGADSWKGGGHPEDIPAIEAELRDARAAFDAFVRRL